MDVLGLMMRIRTGGVVVVGLVVLDAGLEAMMMICYAVVNGEEYRGGSRRREGLSRTRLERVTYLARTGQRFLFLFQRDRLLK